MSADVHGPEHSDRVSQYAMRVLPAGEVPIAERQIGACAQCREELDALRPIVECFGGWPTDVLQPSTSIWDRLARRVATETGRPALPAAEPSNEPEWTVVAPGISVKLLATDSDRQRVSMLVRLDPGTDYPPHTHAGVEELHLLAGELWINERKLEPGDYSRAEPDTADRRVWSETGCTCVLVTSPRDVLR
jgi:hypothetical protein